MSGDLTRCPLFTAPIGTWHDWFAWRPVRTHDQRLVWLRWIRRRLLVSTMVSLDGPDDSDLRWQYYRPARTKAQGARHG